MCWFFGDIWILSKMSHVPDDFLFVKQTRLIDFKCVLFLELKDIPPAIVSISFGAGIPSGPDFSNKLTKPQDFVVKGSNSNSRLAKNELICEASNADTLDWEYRTLEKHSWSRTLPTPIQLSQPVPKNGGELISLTIDDGNTTALPELIKLNGFYRCTAENSKSGNKVQAPPVRIILPCKFISIGYWSPRVECRCLICCNAKL